MTRPYRNEEQRPEHPFDAFFRPRWAKGSLLVLDIDRLLAPYDLRCGLLIEDKYAHEKEKEWRVTREVARRLGFWSALFEYEAEGYYGPVEAITATFVSPAGERFPRAPLDFARFDEWICSAFGARRNHE